MTGAVALVILVGCGGSRHTSSTGARATTASCQGDHWIGAWADAPSDASAGSSSDKFDASGQPKVPVDDATIRAILTPTYGGSTIRVHLSNRFGQHTSRLWSRHDWGTGRRGGSRRARYDRDVRRLSLGHGRTGSRRRLRPNSVCRLSDADARCQHVRPNDVAKYNEHYTARQTSYITAQDAGDQSADTSGSAFTVQTTTRPYVDGIDVLAPDSSGAVVALGDSITDGYQGEPPDSVPEVASTLNKNGRWTDDLARRLIAAHIPLSVLNEGISGNKVLHNGAVGGNDDAYGPSALSRLQKDVIDQAGVTTVIWLEGINDIGQKPHATATHSRPGTERGSQ